MDFLASNLKVDYIVYDNINTVGELDNQWTGQINLTNAGEQTIIDTSWEIYFCAIRLFEWDVLRHGTEVGAELGDSSIEVYHVAGCLHKLVPMTTFAGFMPEQTVELPFKSEEWSIAVTDMMPR